MRRLWLLMVVMVMIFPVQAQEERGGNPPYFYYYSDFYGTTIFESANGQERYRLDPALFPASESSLVRIQWSPSYRKFLIRSHTANWQERDPMRLWFYDLDTQELGEITAYGGYGDMVWAQNENRLMVFPNFYNYSYLQPTIDLIELPSGRVLVQQPKDIMNGSVCGPYLHPSGDFISVDGMFNLDVRQIWFLTSSGEIFERFIGNSAYLHSCQFTAPDGQLSYLRADKRAWILEDVENETQRTIELPGEVTYISTRDEWAAILHICEYCSDDALFDPNTHSVWFLDLKTLSVIPLPTVMVGRVYLWSDDLRFLYVGNNPGFLTQEIAPLVYSTSTWTAQQLPSAPDGQPLNWQWGDNTYLRSNTLPSDNQSSIAGRYFLFDVNTGTYTLEPEIPVEAGEPRYIVTFDQSPMVLDTQSGSAYTLPLHPAKHRLGGTTGGELDIYPESHWALTQENNSVAGGNWQPTLSRVMRVDGSYNRPLANKSYPQWFPEEVSILDLPLVSLPAWPTPSTVFEVVRVAYKGNISALSWSPDGTHIAADAQPYFDPATVVVFDTQLFPMERIGSDTHKNLRWLSTSGTEQPYIETMLPDEFLPLATSSDGQQYIAVQGLVRIFNAQTDVIVSTFVDASEISYPNFTYHPTASIIASGGQTEWLKLWNADSFEQIATLEIYASAVAFSPDGKWLAVGSGWEVHLYDVQTLFEEFCPECLELME